METVLGLLGVAAYILGVLTLAAGVTYVVVRLSPAKDRPKDAKS
jgi:hypothetical protein